MDEDFTLGPFRVRPSLGCAERDGRTIHLRARVVDLLVFFCAHPDVVLSPQRLLEGVWGTSFVTASVLSRTIAEIRNAFQDDAADPWLIETIAKRGYRLVARPEFAGKTADSPPRAHEPEPAAQPPAARETPSSTKLWLTGAGVNAPLGTGTHVVGRDPGCAVVIASPWVSRQHAEIEVTEHGSTIRDLESHNGTFLNERRLSERATISHGDKIWLGRTRLVAYVVDPDCPTVAESGDWRPTRSS